MLARLRPDPLPVARLLERRRRPVDRRLVEVPGDPHHPWQVGSFALAMEYLLLRVLLIQEGITIARTSGFPVVHAASATVSMPERSRRSDDTEHDHHWNRDGHPAHAEHDDDAGDECDHGHDGRDRQQEESKR